MRTHRFRSISSITAALIMLAGCGGPGSGSTPASHIPIATSAAAKPTSRAQILYVGNMAGRNENVTLYSTNTKNTLIRSIALNAFGGIQLGVGPDGDLYVSASDKQIQVFNERGTKILRTLTRGVRAPHLLEFDGAGTLYDLDERYVLEFPHGHEEQIHKLRPSDKERLNSMAVAPDGTVYVATNDDVERFLPGAKTPSQIITNGLDVPWSLALDSTGNLYVANNLGGSQYCGDVQVYSQGASTPTYTIPPTETACRWFQMLQGPDGNMYAIAYGKRAENSVLVYPPGQAVPIRAISSGLEDPDLMVFDSAGNLYVLNEIIGIAIYGPGQTTELRKITNGIDYPMGLGVSP
jgi:sugar lactone lactonase YvrE